MLTIFASTYFWSDMWLSGMTFQDRFCRQFDLSENQLLTVAEMFALGWGKEGEAWRLRRSLLVWEEELVGECRYLLITVNL